MGTHGEPGPTLLDEALAAASEDSGSRARHRMAARPTGRPRGNRRRQRRSSRTRAREPRLKLLHAGLSALEASSPPPIVADRIPWLRGAGTVGLAEWSLERRLPGTAPPLELSDSLLAECVEFLAELHLASRNREPDASPRRAGGGDRRSVRAAGSRSGQAPGVAPRRGARGHHLAAFGHGDFWDPQPADGQTRPLGRSRLAREPAPAGCRSSTSSICASASVFQRKSNIWATHSIEHLLALGARPGATRSSDSYCQSNRSRLDSGPSRVARRMRTG